MSKTQKSQQADATEIYAGTATAVATLRRQILVAQGTGFLLILIPLFVLGKDYLDLAFFAVPVVLVTAVFFAIAHYDELPVAGLYVVNDNGNPGALN